MRLVSFPGAHAWNLSRDLGWVEATVFERLGLALSSPTPQGKNSVGCSFRDK